MIPFNTITAWGVTHPWPTREQVEQDLLLSQALCEIYSDPPLSKELVFRGGTAFHKLYLPEPYRYSEDIDFVRVTAGGIGEIMKRLTELGRRLGYVVNTQIGSFPKVLWRCESQMGFPLKVKLEIDTYERSPALPLATMTHRIETDWYQRSADLRVFQPEELIATKLRALYQRAKGRDLFDIWLALTELQLDPARVIAAFAPYRPERYSSKLAIANLDIKLASGSYRQDIGPLVSTRGASSYDIDVAAELVKQELLANV